MTIDLNESLHAISRLILAKDFLHAGIETEKVFYYTEDNLTKTFLIPLLKVCLDSGELDFPETYIIKRLKTAEDKTSRRWVTKFFQKKLEMLGACPFPSNLDYREWFKKPRLLSMEGLEEWIAATVVGIDDNLLTVFMVQEGEDDTFITGETDFVLSDIIGQATNFPEQDPILVNLEIGSYHDGDFKLHFYKR